VSLVELPSNQGGIIAIDPHAVSAVQPYRSTIAGRGSQVYDMSAIWLHNRSIYVSAWAVEQVLDVLNTARQSDAELFAAGYREGVTDALAGSSGEEILRAAWMSYLDGRAAS
jgi:hypothetical protein